MSRTPVREGLSRLWQERYLDRVAGHEYFVARVTVQWVRDTFEVRRLLEGAAASRAAELASPGQIDELQRLAILPKSPNPAATRVTPLSRPEPHEYRTIERANLRSTPPSPRPSATALRAELIERCLAQVDRFMSPGVNGMQEHLDRGSEPMTEALLCGELTEVGL